MTLEEFFALADRVAGALNVLREARGEVPIAPKVRLTTDDLPFIQNKARLEDARRDGPFVQPVTNKGAVQWTPEELARKEALRAKQAATLPTDPVMDALEAE